MNTLTALDRCDRCGAQAYVRTDHHGLDLLWCIHHFRETGHKAVDAGAVVTADDREQLTTKGR